MRRRKVLELVAIVVTFQKIIVASLLWARQGFEGELEDIGRRGFGLAWKELLRRGSKYPGPKGYIHGIWYVVCWSLL